jgi:ABC-type enterobactin transport system permease subunit
MPPSLSAPARLAAGAPLLQATVDGAVALRLGPYSLRTTRRRLIVGAALVVAIAALAALALGVGTIALSPERIWQALLGEGTPRDGRVVWGIRVPRIGAALAVGAALGLSGALFQNLTGNPLGSPDVIGFVTGAASGAIVAIVIFSASAVGVALAAVGSGLVTAAVVVLLAGLWGRRGDGGGYRLVLVGIGVGAFLAALNDLLLTRVSGEISIAAQTWLVGSLNSRDGDILAVSLVLIAACLPALAFLSGRMGALQLGDDAASQAGVPVTATRLAMTAVGVLLVGAATAVTGPISFVALAAPQLAWRLAGRGRPALVITALFAAVLLLGADVISQLLPSALHLPVGLVTGLLGGIYLLVLLSKGNRK